MKGVRFCGISLLIAFIIFSSMPPNYSFSSGGVDTRTTIAQGAGCGAIIGGLAGAGIGALTGKKGAVTTGIIIGTAVGGLAGGAYGSYVADKKKKIYEENLALDKLHAEIVARNTVISNELRHINARIEILKQEHAKIKAMNMKYAAGEKQLANEKQSIAHAIESATNQMADLRAYIETYAEKETPNIATNEVIASDPLLNHINEHEKNVQRYNDEISNIP